MVIFKNPPTESPGPDGFTGKFYKCLKNWHPTAHTLHLKTEEDGTSSTSQFILVSWHYSEKKTTQRHHRTSPPKPWTDITYGWRYKELQRNANKPNPRTQKHHDQEGFLTRR
ncbi:hypothetical protein H1C71_007585 [Ictidomys tridecemlineatus]|nr:hypothetical protein H1C71_007585 [Ictidomys tridecemlineatus]